MSQLPYIFTGQLNENSPRYADFERVFGSNLVPLQTPLSQKGTLPGKGESDIYLLSLSQLTEEQMQRLCEFLSERFGTQLNQVRAILHAEGLPILAEEITVLIEGRVFL